MSEPYSTLLIGFGQIAADLAEDPVMAQTFTYATHAQVLRDHPDFQLSAVVDPDEGALAKARDIWGVPTTAQTLEALPESYAPDMIVLATPPSDRIACMDTFPDVKGAVVEKPLGTDLASSQKFVETCETRNMPLQVNLWRRADSVLRELEGGMLNDRIGNPQAISGVYGNGLHNNGVHLIDLIRMLGGEVDEVRALGNPYELPDAPIRGDVHLPFALKLESGATATVQPLDFRHYREIGLDIWGDSGRLSICQEGATLAISPLKPNRGLGDAREIASDQAEYLEPTLGEALYRMYDNMSDALNGKADLWSTGRSALRSETVLEAILDSANGGGCAVII